MSVEVIKAGLMDTLQDGGRFGYGHLGVNPNGPMDAYAAQLANALVGNSQNEVVLEMHFPAATLHFHEQALVALAGADFDAIINGFPVALHKPFRVHEHDVLQCIRKKSGESVYLSVRGGFATEPILNSGATNMKAGFGGWQGRKLQAGDIIPFRNALKAKADQRIPFNWYANNLDYSEETIAVMPGPEWHWLSSAQQGVILQQAYQLQLHSDRMVIKMRAEKEKLVLPKTMLSSAVLMGTVQLLPGGELLVLMADHQTVGGYPRILQVARASLPVLSQRKRGSSLHFNMITMEQAAKACQQQLSDLKKIETAARLALGNG